MKEKIKKLLLILFEILITPFIFILKKFMQAIVYLLSVLTISLYIKYMERNYNVFKVLFRGEDVDVTEDFYRTNSLFFTPIHTNRITKEHDASKLFLGPNSITHAFLYSKYFYYNRIVYFTNSFYFVEMELINKCSVMENYLNNNLLCNVLYPSYKFNYKKLENLNKTFFSRFIDCVMLDSLIFILKKVLIEFPLTLAFSASYLYLPFLEYRNFIFFYFHIFLPKEFEYLKFTHYIDIKLRECQSYWKEQEVKLKIKVPIQFVSGECSSLLSILLRIFGYAMLIPFFLFFLSIMIDIHTPEIARLLNPSEFSIHFYEYSEIQYNRTFRLDRMIKNGEDFLKLNEWDQIHYKKFERNKNFLCNLYAFGTIEKHPEGYNDLVADEMIVYYRLQQFYDIFFFFGYKDDPLFEHKCLLLSLLVQLMLVQSFFHFYILYAKKIALQTRLFDLNIERPDIPEEFEEIRITKQLGLFPKYDEYDLYIRNVIRLFFLTFFFILFFMFISDIPFQITSFIFFKGVN